MVLTLEQVTRDILSWLETFVEQSHPDLGGWPPCPYARRARLDRTLEVKLGVDVYTDLVQLSNRGLDGREVVLFAYDPGAWPRQRFAADIERANQGFLVPRDLIALEDHPDDPEFVNGIKMNQGTYALVLCQELGDLNRRARRLAQQGFYQSWPEPYLAQVFRWREDPRQ